MPSIAEILVEQGRVLADQRRRSGERRGALVTGLGQIPVQIVADRQAAQVAANRAALAQQEVESKRQADARAQADLELRQNADTRAQTAADDARMADERGRQAIQGWMKQHAATLKPEESARMSAILEMPGGAKHLVEQLSKAPEPYTLRENEQRRGPNNEVLASNPKPVEEKPVTFGTPIKVTVNGKQRTARPGSDGQWYIGAQRVDGDVQLYEKPDKAVAAEQDWVMRNGVPTPIPRGTAKAGDTPYEKGTGGAKLTGAQADDVATMDTVIQLGNKVLVRGKMLKWSGVGGMRAGTVNQFAAKNFGAGTIEEQKLRNDIGNIKGTIAKLRGGSALTPQELAMIETYTPTIDDDPQVIQAKIASLSEFVAEKKRNLLRVTGGRAADAPEGSADGSDPAGIR